MPLLDFKCERCGHKFDELVSLSRMIEILCPKCGSEDLSRIYEGKCYFGMTASRGGKQSCSGSCAGCTSSCAH